MTIARRLQQAASYASGTSSSGGGTLPMLGMYSGSFDDQATHDNFGAWPDIASTYYQGNQTINFAEEEARVDNGTDPLLTITAKSSGYTWAQIGDTSNATTGAWLDQWVSDLNTLQQYATSHGRQVWATIDHEAEVKVNQSLLDFTATDDQYPPVWNRWAAKMQANAPSVKRLYWCGGSDTTSIDAIGSQLNASLIDVVTMDPYSTTSHPDSETWAETIGAKTNWVKGRSWFPGCPVALSEHGIDSSHGDSVMAAWYSDHLRDNLADLGLIFGVIWNRQSGGSYQIAGDQTPSGTYPLTQAAITASFAEGGN